MVSIDNEVSEQSRIVGPFRSDQHRQHVSTPDD
jgi:hypothetical protein